LYSNTRATLDDIFHLMLICSDNVAARVIAKSTGLSPDEYAEEMNRLALSLGLKQTHFIEPTGLDPGNVSTAAEVSILLKKALEKPKIREVMAKKDFTFRAVNGRRTYVVRNTNRLLFGRHDVIGGKTGYICEAGYCLALGFNGKGKKLGAVLLGAPSSGCRFRDAARLLNSVAGPRQAALVSRGK
jgi:D-alanyl-D-alanine endopeptidase (penicillin-binding protein 7)